MHMIHHGTIPILAALCILATGCGFTDTAPKQQTATTDTTETATAAATTIPTESTTATAKTVIIKTKAATEMKPDTTTAETAAAPAETNIYAKTAGTWYIDGDTDAAYWVMDGNGSIAAYYASDQLEYSGYLQCADENGEDFLVYQNDGSYVCSFYFDGSDTLSMEGEWGPIQFQRY